MLLAISISRFIVAHFYRGSFQMVTLVEGSKSFSMKEKLPLDINSETHNSDLLKSVKSLQTQTVLIE